MSVQLTARERRLLEAQNENGEGPHIEQTEALRRFYLIWTLKEAYTKALGLGLGFDFTRIEYDVANDVVRIDNVVPSGWRFVRFELQRGGDAYVGVVVHYVGDGTDRGVDGVVEHRPLGDWIDVHDASAFMQESIHKLQP
jgi:4'-phosphopantetheinyl transferase